jgi:outer membrane protein insertion porin family
MLVMLIGCLWAEGETIYEIRVEGTQNIAPELVISAMSVRVGDALNSEYVSRSIKNLYRMGVFSDIQIETEPYRTGINLVVKVIENPAVSSVSYQGFKVVKKEQVEEISGLRIGSYWSGSVKHDLQRKLKAEYSKKGFGNAEIEIMEQMQPENRVSITLRVNEGKELPSRR